MDLFKSITNYLLNKSSEVQAPEGYCPNCWGKQEYGNRVIEAVKHAKIDLNNIAEKKGWIQAYATRHFEGIRLNTTDDVFACPACKMAYKDK